MKVRRPVPAASWSKATREPVAVVPSGFEAYARVFHPARRVEDGGQVAVTWREVAAANGRAAHRAMQWPGIVGAWRLVHGDCQPGLWDSEPEEGSLPVAIAVDLAAVLAAYTSTPGRCWFAVWEGFGALAVPPDAAAFNYWRHVRLRRRDRHPSVLGGRCCRARRRSHLGKRQGQPAIWLSRRGRSAATPDRQIKPLSTSNTTPARGGEPDVVERYRFTWSGTRWEYRHVDTLWRR